MYDYLQGELVQRGATEVTLDVGGVGYRLSVPLSTSARLPDRGPVQLRTHLLVREDRLQLFGFGTEEERAVFQALLRVSGVGPATALSILSHLGPGEVRRAVGAGDAKTLAKVKGVGKKTSARLVLELKDAFPELPSLAPEVPAGAGAARLREDAVQALRTLGYTRSAAEDSVRAAWDPVTGGPLPTVEELVRRALGTG